MVAEAALTQSSPDAGPACMSGHCIRAPQHKFHPWQTSKQDIQASMLHQCLVAPRCKALACCMLGDSRCSWNGAVAVHALLWWIGRQEAAAAAGLQVACIRTFMVAEQHVQQRIVVHDVLVCGLLALTTFSRTTCTKLNYLRLGEGFNVCERQQEPLLDGEAEVAPCSELPSRKKVTDCIQVIQAISRIHVQGNAERACSPVIPGLQHRGE